MAVDDSASGLLPTLTAALESAASAFPDNEDQFLPPTDGISLLDVKNDLLLSYIQNLVFLVLLKLRNIGSSDNDSTQDMTNEVVRKLVELRVYLERGVRPLESKLKYQIDKVVRAADEADRRATLKSATAAAVSKKPTKRRQPRDVNGDVSDDGASVSSFGSDDEDEEEEEEEAADMNGEAEASVGPRPAALLRKTTTDKPQPDGFSKSGTGTGSTGATGAYKPPRITPTAMPEPASTRDRDQPARKRRSQLLDEYIDEELSTAPRAQPSIGSNNTIVKHGRGAMSSRDREKERERQEYEERNFVRLPGESKAERRKARLRGERNQRDMFGGEDWTGLGGLGDRIHRTVAGRARGEGTNLLERREKRRRDTQDGPRGDGSSAAGAAAGGSAIGETFEKRRKIMQQRAEKKARRKG